jgi:RND superfamily putative drug exporter
VVGLTTDGRLVRFDAAPPGRTRGIGKVKGLAGDQSLVGVDYRVQDGRLYGVGNARRARPGLIPAPRRRPSPKGVVFHRGRTRAGRHMLGVVFASLGRFIYRRRVPVALAWVLVLGVGLGVGGEVFGRLGTGSGLRDDAESVVVADLLSRVAGGGSGINGLVDGRPADDPAFQAEIGDAVDDLEAIDGVERVTGPWIDGEPVPGLVARDGQAVLIRVAMVTDLRGAEHERAVERVVERLQAVDAPRVLVGGEERAREEFQRQAQEDLERGETLALPVMVVLLFLVFRGFVAAVTPLLVALVAVAGALLILLGVSEVADISAYSVNVVTMLGLGLAVDYSLLVVSRFREERGAGFELPEAVERTLATAGRTVAFSGLTVAAALCGLLAFAEPFLRSLAWGGIGVVLVAMVAAVTLVPALLGLWGRRIRPAPAHLQSDHGTFYRLSRLVQRYAPAIVVLVAAVLVLFALPFRHARLENSGLESLPRSSESRQLFETVEARFQDGGTDPVVVVVESVPGSPLVADFLRRVEELPGVARVEPRPVPPPLTVLDVIPEGTSEGPVATGLVERIRELERPAAVGVTGPAAFLVDYRDSLTGRLPYALGLIVLATFALLFLMTGSVVVPVKAIVMNVLSLGASFGALVWVFQDGHLSGLLGFDAPGMVDITVPVLIFVFAFGLSMDYEVFLLSRIKEAWDQTGDNDRAVALGLQRTGRIVTSAAALIVIVFLGFAAGELLTIKEVGLGMAIAVVLDATVVRMLLVPATMKLMGRWNWWAPPSLRRLHDRFGLAEQPLPPPRAAEEERVGSLHAGS